MTIAIIGLTVALLGSNAAWGYVLHKHLEGSRAERADIMDRIQAPAAVAAKVVAQQAPAAPRLTAEERWMLEARKLGLSDDQMRMPALIGVDE